MLDEITRDLRTDDLRTRTNSYGTLTELLGDYLALLRPCIFLYISFPFYRCYWHGHPGCKNRSKKDTNDNSRQKKYEKFCHQTTLLLAACSAEVSRIDVLWECQFNALKTANCGDGSVWPQPFEELKQSNVELLTFLSGPKLRPFPKLIIRDSLTSALCEAYALKYVRECGDGKKCYVLDVASLYSSIGIEFPMPRGRYFTLIGDVLAASTITFNADRAEMFLDGSEVIAIAHCRVYPPKNLLHPFLQTEVNGLIVLTLCKACSQAASKNASIQQCTHSDLERSFVSSCSSYEIAYATGLGYKFDLFELVVYREASYFLKPYLTLFAFQKLRHSEYPTDVDTLEKRSAYCKYLNQKMCFLEVLKMELTPLVMKPNAQLRSFFKSCLNLFLGNFGANAQKGTNIQYLQHYQQLLDHIRADNIVDLNPLTERILQVSLKRKEVTPSRRSNVAVAVAITSLARVTMHKKMSTVTQAGGTILRISSDEISFLLPENTKLPFEIGEAFGQFNHKFKNVTALVQVGQRNVSIVYANHQGQLTEHLITSGVMQSSHNSKILTHFKYKEHVENLFHAPENISTPKIVNVQYRNSIKRPKLQLIRKKQSAFNSLIYKRRFFLQNSPMLESVPYGYLKDV